MWENYRPAIMHGGFYPYLVNLIVLFLITSVSQFSYIENINIMEEQEEGGQRHHMGTLKPGD